nr:MAG TPA: Photoactive yellow protein CIS TRANS ISOMERIZATION, TRANS [Caudoviricetes sp.]
MDAEIGYITAFRRPKKVDLNSAGAPSAGGACLVLQC